VRATRREGQRRLTEVVGVDGEVRLKSASAVGSDIVLIFHLHQENL